MRNLKEIGQSFKEQAGKVGKIALSTATAAFLTLSAQSCDQSAKNYTSWETEKNIEAAKSELQVLIEAYNKYFDTYEQYQRDFVLLESEGDIGACKNLSKKMEALKGTIEKTEKKIDKKGDKILDLTEYFYKGKEKAAGKEAKDNSYSSNGQMKRRTFEEYR